MNSQNGFLSKIWPKRERIIARVGDVALVEKVWGIANPSVQGNFPTTLRLTNILPNLEKTMYITVIAAAIHTGLSKSTLRRYARENKVTAIKESGKWLILKTSLDSYLNN